MTNQSSGKRRSGLETDLSCQHQNGAWSVRSWWKDFGLHSTPQNFWFLSPRIVFNQFCIHKIICCILYLCSLLQFMKHFPIYLIIVIFSYPFDGSECIQKTRLRDFKLLSQDHRWQIWILNQNFSWFIVFSTTLQPFLLRERDLK